MVRCLAQGQLNTPLGGAGDQTSNFPVISQPALPFELLNMQGGLYLCYKSLVEDHLILQHLKGQMFVTVT